MKKETILQFLFFLFLLAIGIYLVRPLEFRVVLGLFFLIWANNMNNKIS